jgi:hypothetical protein
VKVRPFYRWYDLYVGIYVDRHEPALYLVMLGFGLKFMVRDEVRS